LGLIGNGDPIAFIWSDNAVRRHMTKGQLAMVAAKAYPAPEPGGRGKKSSAAEKFPMVSSGKLSEARTILSYAPDLVDEVIGGRSLEGAYNEACNRRELQKSAAQPATGDNSTGENDQPGAGGAETSGDKGATPPPVTGTNDAKGAKGGRRQGSAGQSSPPRPKQSALEAAWKALAEAYNKAPGGYREQKTFIKQHQDEILGWIEAFPDLKHSPAAGPTQPASTHPGH
jgi:hypothetical protein